MAERVEGAPARGRWPWRLVVGLVAASGTSNCGAPPPPALLRPTPARRLTGPGETGDCLVWAEGRRPLESAVPSVDQPRALPLSLLIR